MSYEITREMNRDYIIRMLDKTTFVQNLIHYKNYNSVQVLIRIDQN
jgi:hypothetical protein